MRYIVYILYSPTFKRTYTGQTDNLKNRLVLHNSGKVKSTQSYQPWILIHSESFSSRAEAMKREKWFKSRQGRKNLSEFLKHYFEMEGKGLSDSSR